MCIRPTKNGMISTEPKIATIKERRFLSVFELFSLILSFKSNYTNMKTLDLKKNLIGRNRRIIFNILLKDNLLTIFLII